MTSFIYWCNVSTSLLSSQSPLSSAEALVGYEGWGGGGGGVNRGIHDPTMVLSKFGSAKNSIMKSQSRIQTKL
jgi:hypothetical protein